MEIQNNYPNIQDGMALQPSVFINQYVHTMGRMASYWRAAAEGKYGLLGLDGKEGLTLSLEKSELTLSYLSAITKSGDFIYLDGHGDNDKIQESLLDKNLDRSKIYGVFVETGKELSVPYGPGLKEPSRKAFRRPDHKLKFYACEAAQPMICSDNELELARISFENNVFALQPDYIPISINQSAYPSWKEIRETLQKTFKETLRDVQTVASKSNTRESHGVWELHEFCLSISYFMSARLAGYARISPRHHPERLLNPWLQMAGLLSNFLYLTNVNNNREVDEIIKRNTITSFFGPQGATRVWLNNLTDQIVCEDFCNQNDLTTKVLHFADCLNQLFKGLTNYNRGGQIRAHYPSNDSSRTNNDSPQSNQFNSPF